MVYEDCKAILSFLEQALIGIGQGHTLLNVITFFNEISELQFIGRILFVISVGIKKCTINVGYSQ